MKKTIFRTVCFICIFAILNTFVGCTPKPDMVTDEDIIELYNDNKELFDRTAKEVEELEKRLQEINGLYFRYIEHRVEAYSINTQISFNFPDDVYSDLLDCFIAMDSIINEEYDEDDYTLVIGYRTKGFEPNETSGTEFMFGNDVIDVVDALIYSEDNPGDNDTVINDNWYISWWGQV